MTIEIDNWKTQIRKGYLELCLLLIIQNKKRIYGLELMEHLVALELSTKEGTLYPILNRLTADGVLAATWDTENLKGHPRKYYSLTRDGAKLLAQMESEFEAMTASFKKIARDAQ